MSTDLPEVAYGAWPSPITAESLVAGAAGVGEIRADGTDLWWNEQRPGEGGRYQLVRCSAGGARHDLFPAWDPDGGPDASNWNARTAVMEYGGGAWAVRGGVVLFANWADQRLYRVDHRTDPDAPPAAISPVPTTPRGFRYSEPTWLDDHWIVCVRESHEPDAVAAHGEAVNELVAMPVDGSAVEDPSLVRVLVSGPDFVHSPAVAADEKGPGHRLAWIAWDHPRMPWDGTELMLGDVVFGDDGAPQAVERVRRVAGGPDESVVQPGFLTNGDLVFCSDRTGWWNPWRLWKGELDEPQPELLVRPVIVGGIEAEIGGPLWVGGLRWWAEIDHGRLLASATADGCDQLLVIQPDGSTAVLEAPFSEVGQVVSAAEGSAGVVAGSPVEEPAPFSVRVSHEAEPRAILEQLRPSRDIGVHVDWLSKAVAVTFPSADDRVAHALHYPPRNPTVAAPEGTRPPLVVMIHGGPTSAARNRLELSKQFWTTRGFAVVDVDYGGSTGYGRRYRRLLDGRWGVVDVEDAVAAARYLAAEGLADPDRLAIRGGSAGGFTTLAALCFHDVFAVGASHFGVADLGALAADTHKFESRYLDGLVGPWPEAKATYDERSPINHTDGFSAPLIVFQGDEDEVVPPAQSQMIVDALATKGVPHAYLLFAGEQHGFRQAANIVRALEAELWFYGKVLGFDPADRIAPVESAIGLP